MQKYGYQDRQIHLFNFAFSDVEYTDRDFIFDNLENFAWTFQRLCDDKSRRILNYKITKKNEWLEAMQSDIDDEVNQYFDKELVRISDSESFADVGSYVGDTLKRFVEITEGKFNSYYGFEADYSTFLRLKEYSVRLCSDTDNIYLYNVAAWDRTAGLRVTGRGETYGSYSYAEEPGEIKAEALDNILINVPVTLVKMDIEGAEHKALCGLKKTIEKYRPKLAICVYHKRDDYFKIPMEIDKISKGTYKFYFRQYRYTPTETVCYAIPK